MFFWNDNVGILLPPSEFMVFFGVLFLAAIAVACYFDRKEHRKDALCKKCYYQRQCIMEMDCRHFLPKETVDLERNS